jgi:glycolate oxidase iron-sulfur subunit
MELENHPVPTTARHSPLSVLDYSVLQQCMHCGLCLPSCPTYDATKNERNSPRGRIALMRAVADGELAPTGAFADEMSFCVGCLACQTACPAGVNYAELLEAARAEAETGRARWSPGRKLLRRLTLEWLFMDLRRLRGLARAIRGYQRSPLPEFLRRTGILRALPRPAREWEAMLPPVMDSFSSELIPPITPATGERRFRVALLTGCAQDALFSGVNRDTAAVLARNGCEVITPAAQSCCGSLHAHNGEPDLARQLARRLIERFPPDNFDAIITNAGGCGSHLKHFGRLLADDAEFRDRARVWDGKVKDIHEWLVEIKFQAPSSKFQKESAPASPLELGTWNLELPPSTVAYHDSCHLLHGQKIAAEPRQILQSIPGLRLVDLPESSWCCGSAGVYNLTQPEMAAELLNRKLAHIRSTGASIVATANPGCLLQLQHGAKQQGLKLRVVHPITLLAEAYRVESLQR